VIRVVGKLDPAVELAIDPLRAMLQSMFFPEQLADHPW